MAAAKIFKTDAFEAVHSSVMGMYRARTIDDATMRHFDKKCLEAPRVVEPAHIKRLRERIH